MLLYFGEEDRSILIEYNAEFVVRSFYRFLAKELVEKTLKAGELIAIFSRKRVWIPSIPFIVAFFAWKANLEGIQTIDKLNSKGMVNEESVNHLLINYTMAKRIWESLLTSFSKSCLMSANKKST